MNMNHDLKEAIWWMSFEKLRVNSSMLSGLWYTFFLKFLSVMIKVSPTLSQDSPTRKPLSNWPSKKLPQVSSSLPFPVLQPLEKSPLQMLSSLLSIPNPNFYPFLKSPSQLTIHCFSVGLQFLMRPLPWSTPLDHSPSMILTIFCWEVGCEMVQRMPLPWQVSDPQEPSQMESTLCLPMDSMMPQVPCLMVSTLSPKQSQRSSERYSLASILHLSSKFLTKGKAFMYQSYFRKMLCLSSIAFQKQKK